MDDYIGGRFSSSSGVGGCVLSLVFGPEVFADFLNGAAEADVLAKKVLAHDTDGALKVYSDLLNI